MQSCELSNTRISIATDCEGQARIAAVIRAFLEDASLPSRTDATILIKPNLNNDLSALTGNSTDLRVLAALIRILQEQGYTNVTIADGPNIGVFRKNVDVFGRLGIRALTEAMNVGLVDLNRTRSTELRMPTGLVRVAECCLHSDFLINVPKIKTHAEVGMSGAVKNLMGCVVGTDKRLMHSDLAANLVRLNELVKPNWTLVDGLVGMEGNGPGDGVPKRLDVLLSATDSFLLDLAISRLVGLDHDRIPYLGVARLAGHIKQDDLALVDELEPLTEFEPPPPRGLATRALDHSLLSGVRDLTRPIHGAESARQFLHRLGITQDVYRQADARIERLVLDRRTCDDCGRCLSVCPMQLPVTSAEFGFLESSGCLGCLYCVLVCPSQAISVVGEVGFLGDHLSRYGAAIRCL